MIPISSSIMRGVMNSEHCSAIKPTLVGLPCFMITPAQCRAARGLLDWSQQNLADRAGVGIVTVRQFEAGVHEPRRATVQVVKQAFEAAGVEFLDPSNGGAGLRLAKSRSKGK